MKLTQIFILAIMSTFNLSFSQKILDGTYSLRNVQDMSALFHFTREGHFSFEYYYGAVDRFAKGTYSVSGDTIILKSEKEAGKDFTITREEKKNSGFELVVKDQNPILIKGVRCFLSRNGKIISDFETDHNGRFKTDEIEFDRVYIQHHLYPDVVTLIKDVENTNNYFEVKLNLSLQQVSFKGIDLMIKDDHLTCHANYFLPFGNIRFEKD